MSEVEFDQCIGGLSGGLRDVLRGYRREKERSYGELEVWVRKSRSTYGHAWQGPGTPRAQARWSNANDGSQQGTIHFIQG